MHEIKSLLLFYLSAFWQRRWSIAVVTWIVCLAGWIAVAMIPNQYRAVAKLYVDTDSVIDPLMRGLAVSSDIDKQIETMRRTLLSRPNLQEIIQRSDLEFTLEDSTSALQMEGLINALVKEIQVSAEGRNLYRVSFDHRDPQQAYRVVDSVLQVFIEQNVGVTQRDVDNARGFIDRQIAEYEAKLREAELSVAKFKLDNANELGGIERAQRALESAEARLRSLRIERDSSVWTRDQLRTQLASTPAFVAPETATGLSADENQLVSLHAEREQLLLTLTERHPDVLVLDQRIARIEQDRLNRIGEALTEQATPVQRGAPNPLHAQLGQQLRTVEVQLSNLSRQMDAAQGEIDRLSVMVTQTPQVEADLTRLTRDYSVLFENYQQLIQRRESAQFAQRLDAETDRIEFRIVDPPFVPSAPSGPPHGLFMAAVLIGGLGAGLALAFVRVQLDDTYQTIDQLKARLDLPILGAVQVIHSGFHRQMRMMEAISVGGVALALLLTFGAVFYAYQFRAEKPDIFQLVDSIRFELRTEFGYDI